MSVHAEYYENMLHALSHEHMKENVDRHVLVLEKWTRTFADGIYIGDLPAVVSMLNILKDRLKSHEQLFQPVLLQVFQICSKALLESKSNERLRSDGIENIKHYLHELATFLPIGSLAAQTACVKMFRCIANGGFDPSVLSEEVPQSSPKENAMQVTDKIYIQNLIRECGAIAVISSVTYDAFTDYSSKMAELREVNVAIGLATAKQKAKAEATESVDRSNDDDEKSVNSTEESSLQVQSDHLKASSADALDVASCTLSLCLDLSADIKSAALLCQEGMLCNAMITALKEETLSSRPDSWRVSEAIELLWNCLDSYVHFKQLEETTPDAVPRDIKKLFYSSTSVVDFRSAIHTLRNTFRKLLFSCYRQSDREVRNEVLIVFTLFLNFPESIPHVITSGFLNDIVSFGTIGDAGRGAWAFYSQPLPKSRNFVTMTDIDLQLKKQMWLMIGDLLMSDDPDILTCVASSPFMAVLFMFVEQDSLEAEDSSSRADALNTTALAYEEGDHQLPSPVDKRGNPSILRALPVTQLREFQVLAMTILAANAHRMMAEFLRVDGPTRALDVLCHYAESPLAEHKSLVYHTFLLLNRNVSLSNIVNDRLERHDGIRMFLFFFEHSDDETARAQSAKILSTMCSKSVRSQQELRRASGLSPLVQALQSFSERRGPLVGKLAGVPLSSLSSTDDHQAPPSSDETGGELNVFAISVLHCLRSAVLGNEQSEVAFAQKEGMDTLFDVLEVSAHVLRSVALRLICDLLDNPRLTSYAFAWRSHKTMRSIGQLLAHCWMDEEVRTGCQRGRDGVICNLWNALGDHSWALSPEQLHATQQEEASSAEGRSSTVTKLSTAILAARAGSTATSLLALRREAQKNDLRSVLSAVLHMLGFLSGPEDAGQGADLEPASEGEKNANGFMKILDIVRAEKTEKSKARLLTADEMADQNLSPTDRQVICLASRYGLLREGQWWQELQGLLAARGVKPVAEDKTMLDFMTQSVFEAARAIQFEQMELGVKRLEEKKTEEDVFFDHIIQQKNQQIKSEYLKRKSGRK